MLFSTPVFLFAFLPSVLLVLVLLALARRLFARESGSRPVLENLWLTLASLVFYAWGEPKAALLMLASIAGNWLCGLALAAARERGAATAVKILVGLALAFNLGLLSFYKYADFATANWNTIRAWWGAEALTLPGIELPIGISFFTFQALSYVIDLSRGDVRVQKNPLDLALYVALFPQLIAGPIVRYADVERALGARRVGLDDLGQGARRFLIGLSKKMLIANAVARPADQIFALPADELSCALAWLGVLAYALQIYFDFSGYSDMAIGMGRMLGFHFLENFRWPYAAASVTEFWRRWHISLSSWFRDYLYIPLGGNRRGKLRTAFNLVSVFALCGLWHGASWNFLVWGLWHGGFLVLERRFGWLSAPAAVTAVPRKLALLCYTWAVVLAGWVCFRADDLPAAAHYLAALAGFDAQAVSARPLAMFLDPATLLALAAGCVGAAPWLPWLGARLARWRERRSHALWLALAELGSFAALVLLLCLCVSFVAAERYNPFIYFRF